MEDGPAPYPAQSRQLSCGILLNIDNGANNDAENDATAIMILPVLINSLS